MKSRILKRVQHEKEKVVDCINLVIRDIRIKKATVYENKAEVAVAISFPMKKVLYREHL